MNKKDQEYLDAWKNLDPELLEQMKAAGINGADVDCSTTLKPYYSGAIMNAVATQPDVLFDEAPANSELNDRVCEALRRVIGELLCDSNPALALECLSVVTGLGYMGDTMEEIGRRHGVSRAAVSKRCVAMSESFGLNPSRVMRGKTVRKKYAKKTRDQHYKFEH